MKAKIIAMSDLHGILPIITSDSHVIAIAGDISPLEIQRDHLQMWSWIFNKWLPWVNELPTQHVVVTPGNHDFWFAKFLTDDVIILLENATNGKLKILIDRTEYLPITEGDTTTALIVHGSPWIPPINSNNQWGYELSGSERYDKFKLLPTGVDLLVTHAAPDIGSVSSEGQSHYGDVSLADVIIDRKPRYAVCGHIHDGDHKLTKYDDVYIANVSIRDNRYDLAYNPLEFEIEI